MYHNPAVPEITIPHETLYTTPEGLTVVMAVNYQGYTAVSEPLLHELLTRAGYTRGATLERR